MGILQVADNELSVHILDRFDGFFLFRDDGLPVGGGGLQYIYAHHLATGSVLGGAQIKDGAGVTQEFIGGGELADQFNDARFCTARFQVEQQIATEILILNTHHKVMPVF